MQQEGYDVPWSRFAADAWSLEPPAVDELMQKIQTIGVPLADFAGKKPLYGLKTGLNETFLIFSRVKFPAPWGVSIDKKLEFDTPPLAAG